MTAAGPEGFDVAVEQREGVVVVRPIGALETTTAGILDDILGDLSEHGASAVLDLSQLTMLDSAGLRVILAAHAQSRRDGFGLTLLPGPPAVMRIFELAGVLGELPFPEN